MTATWTAPTRPVDLKAHEIITFHPDAPGVPIVLVLSWNREGPGLEALVDAIGDERPIHAVTPPVHDDPMDYPRRVEEWVDFVQGRLDDHGIEGPLIYGGWSFGGVVAAHVGQAAWERAGRPDVRPPVVLVDSRSPSTYRRNDIERSLPHRMLHNISATLDLEPDDRRNHVREAVRRVRRRRERQAIKAKKGMGDTRETMSPLRRAVMVSWFRYEPIQLDVDGTLLWCDDSMERLVDATLGWGETWRGPFSSRRCGGGHFKVFESEALDVIAPAYRAVGARADRSYGG